MAAFLAPSAGASPSTPRIVTSSELFGDDSEVLIVHNGAQYRLRITRQDKLILTK